MATTSKEGKQYRNASQVALHFTQDSQFYVFEITFMKHSFYQNNEIISANTFFFELGISFLISTTLRCYKYKYFSFSHTSCRFLISLLWSIIRLKYPSFNFTVRLIIRVCLRPCRWIYHGKLVLRWELYKRMRPQFQHLKRKRLITW